jgi:PLP dependent protein
MIRESTSPDQRHMDKLAGRILTNYNVVLERIASAARSVERNPDQIRLMVVTKGHQIEVVESVIAAGARLLGENYVDEALVKMRALSTIPGIEWHMIGHVQSRKAEPVSQHFSCVHSVDSLKLANRLNRFTAERNQLLPVLLECNVSGEESKFGLNAWNEGEWDLLAKEIAPILDLPALEVHGLMAMPPFFPNPEEARPYFQKLRRLQICLQEHFSTVSWKELSMGMSGDFEVAVQEGATIVRVGTAILGERTG